MAGLLERLSGRIITRIPPRIIEVASPPATGDRAGSASPGSYQWRPACSALSTTNCCARARPGYPDIGSVLEKMRREAVAQRVERDALGQARSLHRRPTGGVQHGLIDRMIFVTTREQIKPRPGEPPVLRRTPSSWGDNITLRSFAPLPWRTWMRRSPDLSSRSVAIAKLRASWSRASRRTIRDQRVPIDRLLRHPEKIHIH